MSSGGAVSQTTAVRHGHEIDTPRLQAYLADHLPDFSLPRRSPDFFAAHARA
jgi:hypothetical protein